MSEEQVVLHCSPTLEGIKPGSLFSVKMDSEDEFITQMTQINRQLRPAGVRIIPLRRTSGKALVYVYRVSALKTYFQQKDVAQLLREYGYHPECPGGCIARLGDKLRHTREFPHEVGLFLGYPPEDVKGFIKHKGECSKCVGCWKVYGDVTKAEDTFDRYKKCTDEYKARFRQGTPLEQLAVCA